MRRTARLALVLLVALAVAETALLGFLGARHLWRREAEATAVVRGERLAARMGCFACHGPGGEAPIPNPGAARGTVPRWGGGMWMMYNSEESDVAAWIRDGHPPGREPDAEALIRMPAYGDLLDEGEVADLTAYVLAVSQFGWPEDERVARGREVAVTHGCFGCHGPEGRGLVDNPGSFKGYIPPWDGDDYLELVESDEEFRQWVRDGVSERFARDPAARRFVDTQKVPMPAFGDRIPDDDLEALLAYVGWVRANPRGGVGAAGEGGGEVGGR